MSTLCKSFLNLHQGSLTVVQLIVPYSNIYEQLQSIDTRYNSTLFVLYIFKHI